MASLLRSNIQDFVQEVPVGQMAQGTPFRCLPWPTPPIIKEGEKGEVKPPKLADILYYTLYYTLLYSILYSTLLYSTYTLYTKLY